MLDFSAFSDAFLEFLTDFQSFFLSDPTSKASFFSTADTVLAGKVPLEFSTFFRSGKTGLD